MSIGHPDDKPFYGIVTRVGTDGVCFIAHNKAPKGVFCHRSNIQGPIAVGDVVQFQVDDWDKLPRPTAVSVRALKRLFGTLVEWRGNGGKVLPQRGTEPVAVAATDFHPRRKDSFFRLGDCVSFCVCPTDARRLIAVDKDYAFRRFADLGNEFEMLSVVAEKALNERWEYPGSRPFQILFSYLFTTFERLEEEDKKLPDGTKKIRTAEMGTRTRVAVFDTGLVNKYYKAIYAVFEERRDVAPGEPPWHLVGFCARGERLEGTNYLTLFKELPQRAEYFGDPADLLYDPKLRLDAITHHIVGDRAHRLPPAIHNRIPKSMTGTDEIQAYLGDQLEKAIERAQDRIRWNYKTAVPQYYPKEKRIQLLLPLCLEDPRKVDLALAVQREGQAYVGYTILELNWAYSNARLIARPDSDWLAVEALRADEEAQADVGD